ncbi:hypothetical protein [Pedobacter frigoris]|uniref:Outer membrane protein beta-barrel domain-containing protein n=1 Tax=Pedobacter frigoris TaxID=2571272 RepID=A0A4U1CGD0_9SPHI|nr:hypothetical protein [Pedobacter frigoris]TKC04892.1 hypothetical protein FA047_14055 [Pedobacter frigoris]
MQIQTKYHLSLILLFFSLGGMAQTGSFIELGVPHIGIPMGQFRKNTKAVAGGLGAGMLIRAFGKNSNIFIGPQYQWLRYGKIKQERPFGVEGMEEKLTITNNIYNWNAVFRYQNRTPETELNPYFEVIGGIKSIKNKVLSKNPWNSGPNDHGYRKTRFSDVAFNYGMGAGLNHLVVDDLLILGIGVQYLMGTKAKYVDESTVVVSPEAGSDYSFNVKESRTDQLLICFRVILDTSILKW